MRRFFTSLVRRARVYALELCRLLRSDEPPFDVNVGADGLSEAALRPKAMPRVPECEDPEFLRRRFEELLRKGKLGSSEREVIQFRAIEMGLGFVDLEQVTPETAALASVPGELARKHKAIPVKKVGNDLWVAMLNPQSLLALDETEQVSGCRVIAVMAVPGAIEDAIRRCYSSTKL